MEKTKYKRMVGSQSLRQRLLLATLSSTPIIIEDIRSDDMIPGLLPHEISLIRLFETVSDDCVIEINETGTQLKYKPGIIMGGENLVHNCGLTRSIGYFLEPLLVLGLFGKKPLSIRLKGITNDPRDLSVDTVSYTTTNILQRFRVPIERMELNIEARGVAPNGGGEILLTVPNVETLTAVQWMKLGMVRNIQVFTFSAGVSKDVGRSMRSAGRGIFKNLAPNVYGFLDHRTGAEAGKSPGYGISAVAETTTGCCISVETTVSCGRTDETGELDVEKQERKPAEDTGVKIASLLGREIEKGGVVDSTHQGLLFILCALCEQEVSVVRVGTLTPDGEETLRNLNEFLGVEFNIKPDPSTGTVILTALGCGLTNNLSRKLS